MLTEEEVITKLREYGQRFNQLVKRKEWGKAHNIYNIAMETAVFVDIPEKAMEELFGSYDREGYPEDNGLFGRNVVMRVDEECCIRRNMTYQDIICRKRGMPLETISYYSDANYCARCQKTKK